MQETSRLYKILPLLCKNNYTRTPHSLKHWNCFISLENTNTSGMRTWNLKVYLLRVADARVRPARPAAATFARHDGPRSDRPRPPGLDGFLCYVPWEWWKSAPRCTQSLIKCAIALASQPSPPPHASWASAPDWAGPSSEDHTTSTDTLKTPRKTPNFLPSM